MSKQPNAASVFYGKCSCVLVLGAAKPLLVCHCWTDTKGGGGGRGSATCCRTSSTDINKTGAASPFDRNTGGGAGGGRGTSKNGKNNGNIIDDSNTNPRCKKMFDFDTKKGVCAGNTITKANGRVYIADSMAVTGRINVYDQEGQYEKTIYNDEMKCPRGMAVAASPDQIVLCDSYCENGSQLVIISAADGKVVRVSGSH